MRNGRRGEGTRFETHVLQPAGCARGGVGGGMWALEGLGVRQKDMVFVEMCPEACAQLKKRFPGARVLHAVDIMSEAGATLILSLAGWADIVLAAIPCQPSSKASLIHVKDKIHRCKFCRG